MKKFQNMRDAWAYILSEEDIKKRAGCPKGYQWDEVHKMCKPIEKRSDKDMTADTMPSYRVWGRTGLNGDGYAWEDKGGNWGRGTEGGAEAAPMSEARPLAPLIAAGAKAASIGSKAAAGGAKAAAAGSSRAAAGGGSKGIVKKVIRNLPVGGGSSRNQSSSRSSSSSSSSSNSVPVSHGQPLGPDSRFNEGVLADRMKAMNAARKKRWDQQSKLATDQAYRALKKAKEAQKELEKQPFINDIKEGRLDLTSRKRTWKDPRNGDTGSRRSNTVARGKDPANGDEGRRAPTASFQGNGSTGRGGKTYEQMSEEARQCPRCASPKSRCRCIGNSGFTGLDYGL